MIDHRAAVLGYYWKMHKTKANFKFKRWFAACVLLFCVMAWPPLAEAAKIQYVFTSWDGPALKVYATRPVGLAPDRPVVFVMHGVNRNAGEYRDQWHDLAIEHDFMLVVPEFSDRDFPGPEGYNLGNVFYGPGAVNPEANWSYSAIEAIFDDVRSRFGLKVETYSLYGHSAGAQFVHRFIFHVPQARVNRIVAANAGWYMMPDFELAFPYGLKGSVIDQERLASGLQLPVTILLGTEDSDPDHPNLRRTPEAMNQGPHRLARGQAFFDAAREAAVQLDVPFNWSLERVEGAGHDNQLMAPAAVPFLIGETP